MAYSGTDSEVEEVGDGSGEAGPRHRRHQIDPIETGECWRVGRRVVSVECHVVICAEDWQDLSRQPIVPTGSTRCSGVWKP